jgi:Zn-dependent protease
LTIDPNLVIPAVIVVAIMLLVGLPVHEFSHAFVAYRLGDGTAKLYGRLTLNPIAHFDPVGGTLLAVTFIGSAIASATTGTPLIGFGWAKPTPVNPLNLEGGRRGEALVAAAGPVSNFVLAAVGALPLRFILAQETLIVPAMVVEVLYLFVQINLLLMIFNLIPIPPLDGSKVLFAFLDRRTEYQVRPFLEQYGFFILLFLLFVPPGNSIGGRIIIPILDAFLTLLVGR